MHEILQKYVSSRILIFPCQGKIPLTSQGFKNATCDKEQIISWEKQYGPNTNWAIATGKASGLTVIDIDNKNNGLDNFFALIPEQDEDSLSYVVRTVNGGLHLYYQYDPDVRTTTNAIPGVDVRNDGAYVIAPPSEGYSFKTTGKLQPLPSWLKQALMKKTVSLREASGVSEGEIGEGGRNTYLTGIAGALRRKGASEEAIFQAIVAENDQRCVPPLEHKELEIIARSVGRYSPEPLDLVETVEVIKASDLVDNTLNYLNNKDLVKGLPTGMLELDALLGGGKRLGEVTAWHAEAKTGKNTLWHYLMHGWLEEGVPIGYASRELSPDTEVLTNLLTLKLRQNLLREEISLRASEGIKQVLSQWPLYFASGYGYMPVEQMAKWMTTLKEMYNVQYFWIDHLHYCLEEPEEHKEASKLAKQIKKLAKDLNVHVDLIIQPNKLLEGQRLSLNSIKGGSAIGQAIDNLITLRRVPGMRNVMEVSLDVARSKLCTPGKFHLEYNQTLMTFTSVDIVETPTDG